MLTHLNVQPVDPKRVVVMGAKGFVGMAISQRCLQAEIPVLPLTRSEVDLLADNAAQTLASFLEPEDAFVAVAAIAPVKTVGMLADNLRIIRSMVEALTIAPVAHLLNIGSDAVFADLKTPLTEASPKAPGSLHGAMHLARELCFQTLDIPQATLRPTLIYGATDPHNGYGPNRFRRLAQEGQDIILFGEGEERRDHILINDVAELAFRILTHRCTGSLNAATGHVTSFHEVAETVVAQFKTAVAVKGSPRSGPMPHGGYRPFDVTAIHEAFPDLVLTPLVKGLQKVHQEVTQ